ncbi:5-(carboxyamino)imidazole ribonucleotide synthase [Thalassotalea sp. 1_MG-2023]|uniref:5-(carboxyamino)imidazole ribonucleotide synthase n=1 Tax=Thalassotalea sp. 1_MG-2023 TaxID=3062680 RepID=UPI0026E2B5E5|nr:5-(carboxyamino)imidazole ribonucleotide synthase [Thalassotalea sp. 1_MG-2023]MDO6427618.1 5-(carboxyamino)imidazole ribonucleotide synthase [Thalassotalea sp. 1_MG-2023]
MKKVLVLGAGQLARMMDLAGSPLNMDVKAFDVRTNKVVHPLAPELIYGDLTDGINNADVITAEFEHVAHDTLAQCEASGKLLPSSQAIKIGGDRRLEKALLENCQVANAKHVIIDSKADFDKAIAALNLPIIFKSALEGYDGKGQWRLKSAEQAEQIWQEMYDFIAQSQASVPQGIVAEQMVPFERELSLVGARSTTGEIAVYPLTENHHTNGILSVSLAAPVCQSLQTQAHKVFTKLTEKLDYVGILAIEFFQVGEQLLVNEIAPRVHNSGHWTQQGTDTCQFENHLRAICGLPLGNTELNRPTAMINIIGEDSVPTDVLATPSVTMHWYEKEKRAGRKMGHINISGNTQAELAQRLNAVAQLLDPKAFPEVAHFAAQYQENQN